MCIYTRAHTLEAGVSHPGVVAARIPAWLWLPEARDRYLATVADNSPIVLQITRTVVSTHMDLLFVPKLELHTDAGHLFQDRRFRILLRDVLWERLKGPPLRLTLVNAV